MLHMTISELISKHHEEHQQNLEVILADQKRMEKVQNALMGLDSNRVSIELGSYGPTWSITVTGDEDAFNIAWKAIRNAGFKPGERPDATKKTAAFNTTFWSVKKVVDEEGEESEETDWDRTRIHFYFTSTVCKLKQVGEETVTITRPKYETVCE